jgi:hypothetical protein
MPEVKYMSNQEIGAGLGFLCFCGSIWVMRQHTSKNSLVHVSDHLDH